MIERGADYYLVYGGGLGDVVWDYLRCPYAAALRSITQELGARVKVITCCHNSGVTDLFVGNPYLSHHEPRPWKIPSVEESNIYSNKIDGWRPLQREQLHPDIPRDPVRIYLNPDEQLALNVYQANESPLVVMQPFAGLSNRDAFTPHTLRAFIEGVLAEVPDALFLVLGNNDPNGHESRREELGFEHPRLVNLIDETGIRFNYHLTSIADVFVGSFSNLVRSAWDFRRRTIVVLDEALRHNGIPRTDARYTYGWEYPECTLMTYPAIDALNIPELVRQTTEHLLLCRST